jgi:hypothetical protein
LYFSMLIKLPIKKKTSTRYFPMIFREQFHKHCKMLWNFAKAPTKYYGGVLQFYARVCRPIKNKFLSQKI